MVRSFARSRNFTTATVLTAYWQKSIYKLVQAFLTIGNHVDTHPESLLECGVFAFALLIARRLPGASLLNYIDRLSNFCLVVAVEE